MSPPFKHETRPAAWIASGRLLRKVKFVAIATNKHLWTVNPKSHKGPAIPARWDLPEAAKVHVYGASALVGILQRMEKKVTIRRRDLYRQVANIHTQRQWLKVAEAAGLRICRGGKHPFVFRDPKMPDDESKASLVAVIPNNLHKIMNQQIFKHLLAFGVPEELIWQSLGLAKDR